MFDRDFSDAIHMGDNIWELDGCYYFADETERLDDNGPFETLEAAKEASQEYAIWLNAIQE